MPSLTHLTFSLLPLLALALPSPGNPSDYPNPPKNCVTEADAQAISQGFLTVTGGIGIFDRSVGEALLAPDFSDSAQSVASIVNVGAEGPIPLYEPTFASKAEFLDANAAQPKTEFEVLNLYWTCNVVIQRFETQLSPQRPRGISIFEVVPAPEGNQFNFQIKQVYGELNSVAWLVSTGDFAPGGCANASNTTAAEKRSWHGR